MYTTYEQLEIEFSKKSTTYSTKNHGILKDYTNICTI